MAHNYNNISLQAQKRGQMIIHCGQVQKGDKLREEQISDEWFVLLQTSRSNWSVVVFTFTTRAFENPCKRKAAAFNSDY